MSEIAINIESHNGISETDEVIDEYIDQWRSHRIIVKGARAVRKNAKMFLPMPVGMPPEAYSSYVKCVTFYPATSRTHEGLLGLMFYKPGDLQAPDEMAGMLSTITADGLDVENLAKEIASDYLITGYGCLVVDYPSAPPGISQAEAIATGVRPFIAFYRAESILGVPEVAVVNNRRRIVRIRLLDDVRTVRELVLINGIYTINIHRKVNDHWTVVQTIIPTKNGKPIDEIPVVIVTDRADLRPANAALAHVAELNIDHYRVSADYDTMRHVSTIRIWVIAGADINEKYNVYPGSVWQFPDKDVHVEQLGAGDNSLKELQEGKLDIEVKLSIMGSRILENPKTAVEAADTQAIRQAAANATTGGIARLISAKLNEALEWVNWWQSPEDDMAKMEPITYTLNTEYNALPLTAADRTQIMAEWQSGLYSKSTAIALLQDAGCLPEKFNAEADAELLAQEMADRPPVDAIRPIGADQTGE